MSACVDIWNFCSLCVFNLVSHRSEHSGNKLDNLVVKHSKRNLISPSIHVLFCVWSDYIWNVSYIELQILKSSKLWSSQLWTQFKQLHIEAWKSQDFNVEVLTSFRLLRICNCLNCVHNCDDHSLLGYFMYYKNTLLTRRIWLYSHFKKRTHSCVEIWSFSVVEILILKYSSLLILMNLIWEGNGSALFLARQEIWKPSNSKLKILLWQIFIFILEKEARSFKFTQACWKDWILSFTN